MSDIAIITGASGAIGAAVAKLIHEKSAGQLKVCIHYNGNEAAAKAVSAEIPGSFIVKADLSTEQGRKTLMEAVLAQGSPYCLINNAGIDKPHEPALMVSEAAYDKIMDTNLRGPLFLMRDFAKEMARNEAGVIVNISSVLAKKSVVTGRLSGLQAALEALTLSSPKARPEGRAGRGGRPASSDRDDRGDTRAARRDQEGRGARLVRLPGPSRDRRTPSRTST